MRKLSTFLFALSVILLYSCDKGFSPRGVEQKADIPHAIVSVEQSRSASEATIILKVPQTGAGDFELVMSDNSGAKMALSTGDNEVTGQFNLRKYTASGLTAGTTYKLLLTYTDSQQKQIATSRTFAAKAAPNWRRLPHVPVFSGDFTGAGILSSLFRSQLAVYRYQNASTWNILKFINNKWESSETTKPIPRHNAIAFPLTQIGGQEHIFMGFGYLDNDKLPGKKAYLNDFWWTMNYYYIGQHSGVVFPLYEGIDRDVKYFLIDNKAYLLKENYSGGMWSMAANWEQEKCVPLPEKTGQVAAFTVSGVGYVVNQSPGAAAHLFAYYADKRMWVRKADFPGKIRNQGIGFSAKQNGYFGLGFDLEGNGVRDLWQYDPVKNRWTYHSEYPGQGSKLLVSFSDENRAFLGWGYEQRMIEGTAARQIIGCTDFWEFNP